MRLQIVSLVGVVILFSACTIHQNIEPVEGETLDEICVVRNEAVKEDFLTALTKAIEKHDIATRVIQESEADSCVYRVTYTANWNWDVRMYLVYTHIRVWKGQQKIGESEYDSSGGSMTFDKFVNAEEKVNELVDALFAP